ncbi:hypothetical protein TROLL_128 [Bacillus phage Troll]|uniref:Uncharacterized protein n=2 Tax=Caudoviricetes TaxID=2731619 RepID=S5Y6N4_9CAUD|nr:hypothetical protein TROLL_128 [Bacillus phage Troll]AGT13432.1 hypothetical protein TROLL_128 [Bacillus phage Troll]QDH49818.1 hypothetical protein BEYONPHE_131 [Bacillus phage Beyonphe]
MQVNMKHLLVSAYFWVDELHHRFHKWMRERVFKGWY